MTEYNVEKMITKCNSINNSLDWINNKKVNILESSVEIIKYYKIMNSTSKKFSVKYRK